MAKQTSKDHLLSALCILAAVLSGCTGATAQPDEVEGFAIYLLTPESFTSQADLTQLELEPAPFLSLGDIVAYTWETHEIELTEAARERVASLEVPMTTGVPFVVCVGAERIYPGAFWVSYSSMSYNGVVIDTLSAQMEDPVIRLQLGYPESPELFEGEDLRSDPRILQSLEDAGKLR
jgi:hypothetical protein